jgi:hypothetical protein
VSTQIALAIVNPDGSTRAPRLTEAIEITSVDSDSQKSVALNRLNTEDLYPDQSVRSRALNTALSLLGESDQFLMSAVKALRERDGFGADDFVNKFIALLPELFSCREIGDGFALSVTCVFYGLQNLEGVPANEKQLLAIASVIRSLRHNIFCTIDLAVSLLDSLEKEGLDLNAPLLTEVAKSLSGEAISD